MADGSNGSLWQLIDKPSFREIFTTADHFSKLGCGESSDTGHSGPRKELCPIISDFDRINQGGLKEKSDTWQDGKNIKN